MANMTKTDYSIFILFVFNKIKHYLVTGDNDVPICKECIDSWEYSLTTWSDIL